ncbi:protein prenylyltransferase [Fomitiporia mediterranea MF3/22]|uniref:protein prenylyltransferase n=1 Tax=Fomitiporia mediterranea (strain MF3/22) TaxID=694068 RepID=UPI0004409AA5|nr:protein prenylyltransferase [Fomitiporia mediterranea MF3/22]EJD08120.1 protein prenylyltransferase [Fomitiporia mediterranea MF3/22]
MDNISKLAHLLTSAPKTIELIPGSGEEWLESYPDNIYTPFLFVEGNIGVPEKVLYKTYVAAVTMLGNPRMYLQKLRTNEDVDRRQALGLTSVILLANPGHQSALNIRKTIIFRPDFSIYGMDAIRSELIFTAVLLSAKECAKVSMLWHHRRILLSHLYPTSTKDQFAIKCDKDNVIPLHTDDHFVANADLSVSALQTEFNVVRHACELYPRNYFAWYHRTLCLRSFLTYNSGSLVNLPMIDLKNVLTSELEDVNLWISRHVSDHSAMDYMCRIVDALDEFFPVTPSGRDLVPEDEFPGLRHAIACIRNTLNLVEAFPSHEALWLYLRRNLLMFRKRATANISEDPAVKTQNEMTTEAESLARNILIAARQRCEASSDTGSPNDDNEVHIISRYSLRFLLWLRELVSFTPFILFASGRR